MSLEDYRGPKDYAEESSQYHRQRREVSDARLRGFLWGAGICAVLFILWTIL